MKNRTENWWGFTIISYEIMTAWCEDETRLTRTQVVNDRLGQGSWGWGYNGFFPDNKFQAGGGAVSLRSQGQFSLALEDGPLSETPWILHTACPLDNGQHVESRANYGG